MRTGDAELDRVLFGDRSFLGGVLTQGNFRGRLHAFVEEVFALGTGAAVMQLSGAQYDADGMLVSAEKMALDFLPADQIFPLYVENGEVVSCAFLGQNGTAFDENGEPLTMLSVHRKLEEGRWCVTNHAFDENLLPTYIR